MQVYASIWEYMRVYASIYVTLVSDPYRLAFNSVESDVGFPYPEYAIVISGASESHYLMPLVFRGF